MKQKHKNKSLIAVFLLLAVLLMAPSAALAVVDAPADVYVGDYAGVLTEETEQYIITQNQKLAEATGAQIVVITVDFLDGMEIEDYAYTIFNDWGIGSSEKNNGLLLLLAIGEENYYAMQGQGLEGVLSSGTLGDYLYDYLEDDFAAGDYDAGVYKVFNAFLDWFSTYYDLEVTGTQNAAVQKPQSGITTDKTPDRIPDRTHESMQQTEKKGGISLGTIIVIAVVVIILISMNNRRKDRKNKKNNRPGGGSGGGRYYENDGMGDYGRSTRRTVYVPTGHTGSSRSSRKSGSDLFGGGSSRGGGAGRRSSSFGGGFGGSSGGFGGGFGGGSSRGGGAGRR